MNLNLVFGRTIHTNELYQWLFPFKNEIIFDVDFHWGNENTKFI